MMREGRKKKWILLNKQHLTIWLQLNHNQLRSGMIDHIRVMKGYIMKIYCWEKLEISTLIMKFTKIWKIDSKTILLNVSGMLLRMLIEHVLRYKFNKTKIFNSQLQIIQQTKANKVLIIFNKIRIKDNNLNYN